MTSTVSIISQDTADALWVVRDRIKFMGDLAGTDLAVVELEVPPQSGTPPHYHASIEIFRVLSGEVTFGVFDSNPPKQVVAGPGTVVTIPSNTPHNYVNASGKPVEMMVVVERQMTAFFRDLGRKETPLAGPPGDAEIAAIMAACQRHEIGILGGPPA